MKLHELLMEQVAALETVLEEFGVSDVADIVENHGFDEEDLMFPVSLMEPERDRALFAVGYIRGMAEAKNVTIRQLFEEAGIACERTN